jgi:GntR family transcriptional regulator
VSTLPLQLSAASGVPFYRQVVDQISALVRSGQLAPGTRMPSVRELAAQLMVSLITVRRAYADLETAGLVIRRQGQGTFVADDVGRTSQAQAQEQAFEVLERAVRRARQLGLDRAELLEAVQLALDSEEDAS